MPMLSELLLGFVKSKGHAIFWKGSSAVRETTESAGAIKQMGAEIKQTLTYTLPEERDKPVEFSLIVCQKTQTTPEQYPRPFGIIKKKPLA
jgi:16S rRNA (guanine527-N7)-methyltransferase